MDRRTLVGLDRRRRAGLVDRGRDPGLSQWTVGDGCDHRGPRRAHRARAIECRHRWQRTDAIGDLAAEPWLDVGRIGLVPIGGATDQVVEHLVDLAVQTGLIGEARELLEERPQGLTLVTGQVEADFAVHGGVSRDVPDDGRGRRRTGHQRRNRDGRSQDHGHDGDRSGPAQPTAAPCRRRCRHDRLRCRPGHVILVDGRPGKGSVGRGERHRRRGDASRRRVCRRRRRRDLRFRAGRVALRSWIEFVSHGLVSCRFIADPSSPRGQLACRHRRVAS